MNFVNNWSRPITLAAGALACPLDLPDGTYRLCISNADRSLFEVVDAAVASGTAALTRGLEGTAAQSWLSGSTITASVTAEMLESFAAAGATWGGITGSLADQADLQAALNSKATSAQGAKADSAVQPAALTAGLSLKVDKVAGYGLSQENYTPDEKAKLAALDGNLWKGEYPTLVALQAAHPTAAPGSSANVDAGAGDPVLRYIWDDNDSEWVAQAGSADPITAAQVKTLYESNPDTNAYTDAEKSKLDGIAANATANPNTDSLAESGTPTNKWFTEARVRAAVLTGLSLATSTAVAATDSVLAAIGKLAARLALKEQILTAGTNIAIDRSDPENPVISASVDGGGASFSPVITESTTARTLALTDAGAYIRHTNTNASTVTVAPHADVTWADDTEVHIRRAGAGNLTLAPGAGVTLNAPSGGTLVMTDRMSVTLKRVAPDVWDVIGQTVAA